MINIKYSPSFIKKLKKVDIRIRKSFKEQIQIFERNPNDPQLNNHELKDEYEGFRSINITADYRAIFTEVDRENERFAYFVLFGTHGELYQAKKT